MSEPDFKKNPTDYSRNFSFLCAGLCYIFNAILKIDLRIFNCAEVSQPDSDCQNGRKAFLFAIRDQAEL